jgi:tetratricopeptide (TPR) repeat protein
LRATIDWSFQLLDRDERAAVTAFAVFAGGATIEAVEQVTRASLDVLAGLVAKNLLVRRGDRLAMLETVRQHATEQLACRSDADAIRLRHVDHAVALVSGAEHGLRGPDCAEWLTRLDREAPNLRAALGWALANGRPERALAIVGYLREYWLSRGLHAEGLEWADAALQAAATEAPAALRAGAELTRASMRLQSNDVSGHNAAASEALAIFRRLDDALNCSRALEALALGYSLGGDLDGARRCAGEALQLARAAGDSHAIAEALGQLAY